MRKLNEAWMAVMVFQMVGGKEFRVRNMDVAYRGATEIGVREWVRDHGEPGTTYLCVRALTPLEEKKE